MFQKVFRKISEVFSSTMPFYAVRIGRNPGVYQTWNECKAEVEKFPKARYKKFDTELDAKAFVSGFDHPGIAANSYSPTKSFPTHNYNSPKKANTAHKPSTSTYVRPSGSTPSKSPGKCNTELVDKEMEILKGRLEILEKQKALAIKEQELEDLQNASGSSYSPTHASKAPKQFSKHGSWKPYSRPFSTSATKTVRKVKMLEIDEVRELAKESSTADLTNGAIVYTDGACVNNGRHAAQAGIGVYWGPNHPCNVSARLPGRPTNNRAEIHAVVKAAEQAKEMGLKELNVHTDSQFLINSMTKWIYGWKKNGWKLSSGGPVINREDFEALERESRGLKINYTHVRGHQGIAGNEAADRLAVKGASKQLGE